MIETAHHHHHSNIIRKGVYILFTEQFMLYYYSLTYSTLFFLTWLQFNTGQSNIQNDDDAGNDLNVEPAWIQGYTGCNSIVGVVDDGKKKIHL